MVSSFDFTWGMVAVVASFLGLYILFLLAIAAFLAICGVSRAEIAKWALKQADRQRLTDLIRAARGLPSSVDRVGHVQEPQNPPE